MVCFLFRQLGIFQILFAFYLFLQKIQNSKYIIFILTLLFSCFVLLIIFTILNRVDLWQFTCSFPNRPYIGLIRILWCLFLWALIFYLWIWQVWNFEDFIIINFVFLCIILLFIKWKCYSISFLSWYHRLANNLFLFFNIIKNIDTLCTLKFLLIIFLNVLYRIRKILSKILTKILTPEICLIFFKLLFREFLVKFFNFSFLHLHNILNLWALMITVIILNKILNWNFVILKIIQIYFS